MAGLTGKNLLLVPWLSVHSLILCVLLFSNIRTTLRMSVLRFLCRWSTPRGMISSRRRLVDSTCRYCFLGVKLKAFVFNWVCESPGPRRISCRDDKYRLPVFCYCYVVLWSIHWVTWKEVLMRPRSNLLVLLWFRSQRAKLRSTHNAVLFGLFDHGPSC